jgi:hypothetical protein
MERFILHKPMFLLKLLDILIGPKFNSEYRQTIDLGEGVFIYYTQKDEIVFENRIKNVKFMMKDSYGQLNNICCSDIDFEKVDRLENSHNAHMLLAKYGFGVDSFNNGIALVWWTLYPDGRYFEDEDGFGGENCDETTVYAYINTSGNVVIPFQDMTEEEKRILRIEAE